MFGIVAAALASLFVERDAKSAEAETVGRIEVEQLVQEIRALGRELKDRR